MRPKIKDDAQRVSLTLSAPKREILMQLAKKRGVSRTQIVEDLLDAESARFDSLLQEGNTAPQPHSGAGAANILKPSAGGSGAHLIRYQTAAEAARSSK